MSSRSEEILTAIIEENTTDLEPLCRKEVFLKAIANGDSSNLPDPTCREEALLSVIAKKGISAGGGSTVEDLDAELDEQERLISELQTQVDNLPVEDLDAELDEQERLISELQTQVDNLSDKEIDVSQTTATVEDVLQGKKFYNAEGEFVEGVYAPVSKLGQVVSGDVVTLTASDLAGATQIRERAFYNCYKLANIIIPSSVTSIFREAFYNCNKLTAMTIMSQTPPSLENTNAISTATTTIYIPKGTLGAYESATNWSSFIDKFVELEA